MEGASQGGLCGGPDSRLVEGQKDSQPGWQAGRGGLGGETVPGGGFPATDWPTLAGQSSWACPRWPANLGALPPQASAYASYCAGGETEAVCTEDILQGHSPVKTARHLLSRRESWAALSSTPLEFLPPHRQQWGLGCGRHTHRWLERVVVGAGCPPLLNPWCPQGGSASASPRTHTLGLCSPGQPPGT